MSATSASFPSKFVSAAGDICEITYDVLQINEISQSVGSNAAGATALFIGTTRNSFEGKMVTRLEYEAHTTLALRTICKTMESVRANHPTLLRLAVHHRIGMVPVGEASIVVAVSSPHRKEAFVACELVLEEVKRKAQIWKREWYAGDNEIDATWKENFCSAPPP